MTAPRGRHESDTTIEPIGDADALDAPTRVTGPVDPRAAHHPPPEPDERRTDQIPAVDGPGGPPGDGAEEATTGGGRPWWRRPLTVGAAVVGLLVVLYLGDLILSTTDVPRGVSVAGVEIGGMSKPDAEQALRSRLGSRVAQPVTLTAGDATTAIDPRTAGLDVDGTATIDRAGEQPFNPWTRVTSLFTDRDVAPVTTGNPFTIGQALAAARPQLDRPATEGTIRFEGTRPVGVPSVPGHLVEPTTAVPAITEHWLDPSPVILPTTELPVTVTPAGIQTAIDQIALPAMVGPVTVVGEGKNATITTDAIGTLLKFRPDGSGGLDPAIDNDAAIAAVRPQLATTEAPARDADFAFNGAQATVVPAVLGRAVDWNRTFADLDDVLARPADPVPPPVFTPPPTPPGVAPMDPPPSYGRAVSAVYTTTPPQVTTEALQALGPATVIGDFKTNGFAADSGQNIRRVAEQVNGHVVAPGDTFSLNGFTGPRDASQGYVEAGIIDDGVPGRGIGGGISQFATTLYNAAYFAGLEDVEHKEHSYYISRYPAGREATVFEGAIDLKFRNDGPSPVLIRTTWTPSSIQVQLYGQKRFDVASQPGPRTNPVPAGTRDLSGNPACKPSRGVAGFTISNTRALRDVRTGQTRSEPRTVRYKPEPEITCDGG